MMAGQEIEEIREKLFGNDGFWSFGPFSYYYCLHISGHAVGKQKFKLNLLFVLWMTYLLITFAIRYFSSFYATNINNNNNKIILYVSNLIKFTVE